MKILCVGRNYARHIEELRNKRPDNPVLFAKPETAKLLRHADFYIPAFSNNVHYEVELLVKICKVGKYIQSKFASSYYKEVGLGIDFTARDLQQELKENGLPWEKAKAFDGSAMIGEKWFDKSAFNDLQDINFSLKQNDKVVQEGNSKYMLWQIDELIAEISKYFTLKIGDVIFTGTPAGVGRVQSGDRLEGFIENNAVFDLKIK